MKSAIKVPPAGSATATPPPPIVRIRAAIPSKDFRFMSLVLTEPSSLVKGRSATLALSLFIHSVLIAAVIVLPLIWYDVLPAPGEAVRAFFVPPPDLAPPPPPCNSHFPIVKDNDMKIRLLLCALVGATVTQAQTYSLGGVRRSSTPVNAPKIAARVLAQSTMAVPGSWDWRWYGVVTPSKDQGKCGSCWAFASTAQMESKIAMAGGGLQDLSEQRMITDLMPTNGCTGPGNYVSTSMQYWETHLASWESCAPYQQSDNSSYNAACQTAFTNAMKASYIDLPVQAPAFPGNLKASIYVDGPAQIQIQVFQDFFDFWNSKTNSGKAYVNKSSAGQAGYHNIAVIGWDDVKQALLCKNSWKGATGGPSATAGPNGDGTFWIAYSGHANDVIMEAANFILSGPTFENTAYTYMNRDVAAAFGSTSVGNNNGHWIQNGIGEGRCGSTGFCPKFYLAVNPDLANYYGAGATISATQHWVGYGSREGRIASAVFDAKYYLHAYSDLSNWYGATSYDQAMVHWNLYGINEGRRGSRAFDAQYYLNANPDVAAAYSNSYLGAMDHWLGWGILEGRQSAADFSIKAYVNRYPDLKAAFGTNYSQALIHWFTYGEAEGRNPAP